MPFYSYSKLECFKRCPYQFKLAYIDRIKIKVESIEAFAGSRFHNLMEEIFAHGKEKDYFVEELLDRYEALWKKYWHPDVKIANMEKTTDDYLEYGKQCVRNFYESELGAGSGFSSKTLGVEVKLDFPLDSSKKNKMIGYVDRLAETDDGKVEIQDYKTSASLPDENSLKTDRQLSIYQLGLLELWKRKNFESQPIEFVWYYVGHKKVYRIPERSSDELDQLRDEVLNEVAEIERATVFSARVNPMCRHCKYQDQCPEYRESLKKSDER